MTHDIKSKIFISFCERDKKWYRRLSTHLKQSVKSGIIEIFDKTKIRPGDVKKDRIKSFITNSSIAILMISADYLSSDDIIDK